jgi:transcriptional regulator with XRE-family HTH domain
MEAFWVRNGKDGGTGLARRLREVRSAAGLSQAAVGKRVGLAHTYISRLENGRITPGLPLLGRLANALQVELYQLFLGAGARPESPKLLPLVPDGAQERSLLQTFREISREDRSLLLYMARQMVSRAGHRSEERRTNLVGQARHTPSDHATARLNQTIGADSVGVPPVTLISEQSVSTAEPGRASKTNREFEAEMPPVSYLLYCVFREPLPPTFEIPGGVTGDRVFTANYNGLGVALSKLSWPDAPLDTSKLLAHERVVESFYRHQTVIPFRCGCWVRDPYDAVVLLRDNHKAYSALIRELEGLAEMGIRIVLNRPSPGRELIGA